MTTIAQDIKKIADRFALTVDDNEYSDNVVIYLDDRYSEDYITVALLDAVDISDPEEPIIPGEYWTGSWSIGPKYGAPLEEVAAWIESTIL